MVVEKRVLELFRHRADGEVVVPASDHRLIGVAHLAALVSAAVLSHQQVIGAVQRVRGVPFEARRLRI